MKYWILMFFPFLITFSCDKSEKIKPVIEKFEVKDFQIWNTLEIQTSYQTLTIFNSSDSADYQNITYDDGIYDIPPRYNNKKIESRKIYFSKTEKDSLAKFIFRSVTAPKFTNAFATDYVGNVKLKFSKINMSLVCEYQSVGHWNEVSDNTRKIYDIIKSKAQFSTQ
jgi:hypothetical protein